MCEEFTPTTDQIRLGYALGGDQYGISQREMTENEKDFDAWLAERDAEKWQEGYDEAYGMARGYGHVDHWTDAPENPYRKQEEV